MNAEKVYASEAGHWYTKSGECAYTVPNKSKPGEERPTTLRDARKLGLLPSVSAISRQIHKPFLETWKIKNAVRYAIDHPFIGGENFEEYVSWVVKKADEEAGKVKDVGQQIHGEIERYLEWHTQQAVPFCHTVNSDYVKAARDALIEFGAWWQPFKVEKSFASKLGYGGRVDLFTDSVVIDFKTKNGSFEPPFGYDEHPMQLAAYRHGLKIPEAKCYNVFISVEQPGKYHVREWSEEELSRGWNMFLALLDLWKNTNSYFP